jgi:Putative zincin peptidase
MVTLNSLPGKPDSNFKEELYWKISEKSSRLVWLNLLSIPLAVVFGIGFFIFVQLIGRSPKFVLRNDEILIFLIGIVAVLAVHEFVHGLIMQSFGARPRYGFFLKGLMFYAKAPGYAFKRNQYIIIVLGPLVSLTILAGLGIVVLPSAPIGWVIALWAIINASAANADLWITTIVLRYPASSYVVDERDGMRILLPQAGSVE